MTWDAARIFMQNLEYLDSFKMHSPSWSFGKPFSKKIGFDIWMSTLIQQYKIDMRMTLTIHDEFAPIQ